VQIVAKKDKKINLKSIKGMKIQKNEENACSQSIKTPQNILPASYLNPSHAELPSQDPTI
jgi:hypothetical protein